jgi:hypothetical protein
MNRKHARILTLCVVGLVTFGRVYAHHSASSEFDVEKVVQWNGVLTKVEWINPHALMHFDVTGPNGKTTNWSILLAGVNQLRRAGLANKSALTIGTTYTLTLNPARDGRPAGIINSMTFPDGRVFRLGGDLVPGGGDVIPGAGQR